jgi:hypothetical protein
MKKSPAPSHSIRQKFTPAKNFPPGAGLVSAGVVPPVPALVDPEVVAPPEEALVPEVDTPPVLVVVVAAAPPVPVEAAREPEQAALRESAATMSTADRVTRGGRMGMDRLRVDRTR